MSIDEVNKLLVMWIKSLSNYYSLISKDEKFVNTKMMDDDFIYNFFTIHFYKNNGNYELSKFQSHIEYYKVNFLKFFDLYFSNSNNTIGNLFKNKSHYESKVTIWKIIFTLAFLEEFCYNKFYKLEENMGLMTEVSTISFYNLTNIPKNLKFKYILKSPVIMRNFNLIISEILSEVEINVTDYQNTLNNIFNNEENCTNNTCSMYDDIYYYEDEEEEKQPEFYEGKEMSCDTKKSELNDNNHNMFLNTKIIQTLNFRLKNNSNLQSPVNPTPNSSLMDEAIDENDLKVNFEGVHTENNENKFNHDDANLHTHFYPYPRPNYHSQPHLQSQIQLHPCSICEEKKLKIEELKTSLSLFEQANINLIDCVTNKEIEIKHLKELNFTLTKDNRELDDTIKTQLTKSNKFLKLENNLNEKIEENLSMKNTILEKDKMICKFIEKNQKSKDLKRVLNELKYENQILMVDNFNLRENLKFTEFNNKSPQINFKESKESLNNLITEDHEIKEIEKNFQEKIKNLEGRIKCIQEQICEKDNLIEKLSKEKEKSGYDLKYQSQTKTDKQKKYNFFTIVVVILLLIYILVKCFCYFNI